MALYEERFKKLEENGGNYTRIWLSSPFLDFECKAGEYDETVVKRIDRLLDMAAKHGIRIKFYIENFRRITNYPASFSSSVPFDKPIYSTIVNSTDDYFHTTKGEQLYIDKIKFLSKRYSNNPNVFGWELWNEVNTVQVSDGIMGSIRWTEKMLPVVKKFFPNHIVMQSMGSFADESDRDWYKSFVNIPQNEIAQVHRYIDPGASWKICQESMDTLSSNAVNELKKMVSRKPVILSEVGAVEANHSGPSKLYEADSLGILLHDMLFAPFFSGAAAPGQSWHWQYYIEKNDLWWHFGRFAHAIENINPVTENYLPEYFVYDDTRFYSLVGKTNIMIWCRDKRCNWKTELVEHIKPEERSLCIDIDRFNVNVAKVKVYDPWKDVWTEMNVSNKRIKIKYMRSVVVKLELS